MDKLASDSVNTIQILMEGLAKLCLVISWNLRFDVGVHDLHEQKNTGGLHLILLVP